MKFLVISLLLCLSAGALAHTEGDAAAPTGDLSTVTETKTETKRYKLTWLEKLQAAYGEGEKRGTFPPIEGSLNAILTGVIETTRGSLKGLEPSVQAVYVTPIPTVRIILAASKIKICGPQTHLEFLLNHVICFVNGPLFLGLGVSPIPVCIKGREVQCYGPYLRLADTITPQMAAPGGCMGLCDADWGIKDVALQEVNNAGQTIGTTPIQDQKAPDSALNIP